ncbi:hypothetical protein A2592_01735 [Candidatus Kaiserbacteria bacterium RIFOXYD1_FULL_42_15]|uniref:Uncharacterized protein n=1 Tax=Candidatus Kaiserbacteria bacterium RIFOXYD1_FULL_42_15 TaxID=1798532 RepID=A0A1F6FPQ2_9BACT|nr:MAG: hypothetical protein A2592_01735 [Candidatus Kaiserbacteria bacterium RIFOXYD1_FULL_42_15]
MPEIAITKEILTSFAGTLLALLSAGFVWVLKSAYEKHRLEVLALAKFERIFANNLTILKDNFDFLDKWIGSLKNNRPYSFHFENYYINEEEAYKISNLGLINRLLSVNYMLRRSGLDFANIYKSYWEVIFKIDSIQDEARKELNLKTYHENILVNLEQMKQGYEIIKNSVVDVVAFIRAVNKVRRHSLFGYIRFLFIDIFPRVTKQSIEKETAILKENIARNEKMQNNHV